MPVCRLGWNAADRTWFEWGVAIEGGRFVWAKLPAVKPWICPPPCWRFSPTASRRKSLRRRSTGGAKPAGVLRTGRLLTVDYGLAAEELFAPERSCGTLRAYRRHQVTDDVLANPGEQDITAHVNFTAIQRAGESAGLETAVFTSQPVFSLALRNRFGEHRLTLANDAGAHATISDAHASGTPRAALSGACPVEIRGDTLCGVSGAAIGSETLMSGLQLVVEDREAVDRRRLNPQHQPGRG